LATLLEPRVEIWQKIENFHKLIEFVTENDQNFTTVQNLVQRKIADSMHCLQSHHVTKD
jgi:hypothetical protein